MENQQEAFLDIRLNAAGAAHLKRLSGTTRLMFLIGILVCAAYIISTFLRSTYTDPEKYRSSLPLYLELKFHTWFVIPYSLLFASQVTFYFRFVNRINKAVGALDTEQFNDAFQFLQRSNLLAVAHMTIALLLNFLDMWVSYHFYQVIKK